MEKKRILVVDDEAAFTRLLKMNLEDTGRYHVIGENQGSKVVRAAKHFKPDLIILDVVMPDIEGGTLAGMIKADPELANIPIIFLTATVSREETSIHEGIIGGFPFLSKPIKMEELIISIDRNIKK